VTERITKTTVDKLTLTNLFDKVEVDGMVGQLIAFNRRTGREAESYTLTFGPADHPMSMMIARPWSTDILILDAETDRKSVTHFGMMT
jgi:hypothetical protein